MLQYFFSLVVPIEDFAIIVADSKKPIVANCKLRFSNCTAMQLNAARHPKRNTFFDSLIFQAGANCCEL